MSDREIKGIDLEDKEMRFFPISQAIMQIQAPTKNKDGWVKLQLPNEMINDIMKMATGRSKERENDQYLISCRRIEQ